jgi:hypothetical protein
VNKVSESRITEASTTMVSRLRPARPSTLRQIASAGKCAAAIPV